MVNPHFDDTIKVIGVDADGKKYDKGIYPANETSP